MSCNCGCHDNDPLMPKVAVITNIRRDTPDVTTFRIENQEGGKPFDFMPGQCAMISVSSYWRSYILYYFISYSKRVYRV